VEQGGRSVSFGYETDARRTTRLSVDGETWALDASTGGGVSLEPTLSLRPTAQMDLSISASYESKRDAAQYIGGYRAASRTEYLIGGLRQHTTALTLRGDYTFAPTLSLQLYTQPFVSAGRYTTFRTVADARAPRFADRYHRLTAAELSAPDTQGARAVNLDGMGPAEFGFANPDFNVQQFNSTAVLRWEYRPGSALFVVWGQGRDHFTGDGRARPGRDAADLFRAPATNVLMVKASYWLGL
jgi:hypothetical protein